MILAGHRALPVLDTASTVGMKLLTGNGDASCVDLAYRIPLC